MAKMHRLITGYWIVLDDVRYIYPEHVNAQIKCRLRLIMVDQIDLFIFFFQAEDGIRDKTV